MIRLVAIALVAILCAPLAASHAPLGISADRQYHLSACYPHDDTAFTQGLFYRDDVLYESTGRVGQSSLRQVQLNDGAVIKSVAIPPPYFGEGATDWGDEIISLTWRAGLAIRWDRATLAPKGIFRYPGEGWGLTHDGQYLIMSDGTATLRFLKPDDFSEQKQLTVTENGFPLTMLNELEYVDGQIYANVWMTDRIVRIDAATGKVVGDIIMTKIAAKILRSDRDDVLNGIAYDAAGDRLLVTGKNWPLLFELRRGPAPAHFVPQCPAMPDAVID